MLDELKKVHCHGPKRAQNSRTFLTVFPFYFAQRWRDRLQASGTLAAGAVATGLLSTVGGGRSMMPSQYAEPEADVTASLRWPVARRGPRDRPMDASTSAMAASANLSAGVPRGADLYGVVYDGAPDERIEPPTATHFPALR